ncbi:MAG: catalase HPII, partial [Oricola sp.]|nr:catalase HPII [Oricola sp.]
AKPARKPVTTLKPSDPLSIMKNPPANFAGRKLGVLVSDGAPAAVVKALKSAAKAEGAMFKVVAPKIGGVTLDNGDHLPADEKIDGGPSVLFDAVALVVSEEGCEMLMKKPEARDFVADAFAHKKFIGYVEAARPLFGKAGVEAPDEGCIALSRSNAKGFVESLRELRCWGRKP